VRFVPALGLCLVTLAEIALGLERNAHAAEGVACAELAERGQESRDQGKLLAAREMFVQCAQATCPIAVQRECTKWVDETTLRIPTLVFSAREADGGAVVARVTLDSKAIDVSSGTAVPVDPGPHTVMFERQPGVRMETAVTALEGQHARVVTVAFPPHTNVALVPRVASPSENEGRTPLPNRARWPASVYVTGGFSVAALGVWAVTGILGIQDYRSLQDQCAPRCASSDVNRVRTELSVSGAALGAGLVLGAVTLLFLPRAR
jgi:hypothetical protein